ncbi:hypothetical protein [Phenylobacterium sp.]|uniref:hypothetical protein n=1 Tax=Phenylobacterium sp. TaxID=1871053 RepID=UPI0025DEC5EC|nr:hypothetical protein [Phenylobacterium sp.]MBX3482558.1 hypothetical protein [Phenylobacterium sp.]MCW5758766.1 hypothetical protein [Phenylobacterium sp.]
MTPLAALTFARTWWKAIPGAVVGAALAFPVGHCAGERDAKADFRAAQAEAALKAEIRNAAANEAAAVQRAADTARVTASKKGRTDAIRAGADEAPSGPECRLQRRRLLDIGYAPADLPVCR